MRAFLLLPFYLLYMAITTGLSILVIIVVLAVAFVFAVCFSILTAHADWLKVTK